MRRITKVRTRRALVRLVGFTLAEILVALALIALLAAVLLPTVAGQILKGDAGRVMQDLEAVRGGIDQFLADVHRYPGEYAQLSNTIETAELDINGNTYPTGLVNKWSGPYVTKDTASTGTVQTGFGGEIQNGFVKMPNTNGIQYLNIRIFGIAATDFDKIDAQVDGTTSPGGRTTGLLRWATGSGTDTTRFMAIPIQ